MYALNIAEDGRILSATFEEYAAPGQPIVEELPDGDISDYLYMDGQFIHDPTPKVEFPEHSSSLESRVETLEANSAEAKEALELILSGVTE